MDSFSDEPRAALVPLRLPWATIYRAYSPFESANISINQRLKLLAPSRLGGFALKTLLFGFTLPFFVEDQLQN
jgi:hypothetical protein